MKATLADVPRIVGMAKRYHAKFRPAWDLDATASAQFFAGLVENPAGLLLVTDKGFLAAVAYEQPMSPGWVIASELMMWAEDGKGASLWRGYRKWADAIGAKERRFSCPPGNKRVAQFMAGQGRLDELTFSEVC